MLFASLQMAVLSSFSLKNFFSLYITRQHTIPSLVDFYPVTSQVLYIMQISCGL